MTCQTKGWNIHPDSCTLRNFFLLSFHAQIWLLKYLIPNYFLPTHNKSDSWNILDQITFYQHTTNLRPNYFLPTHNKSDSWNILHQITFYQHTTNLHQVTLKICRQTFMIELLGHWIELKTLWQEKKLIIIK